MSVRGFVKGILCRFMVIVEFCDDCGVRQPLVWTSSDPLWAEVTGKQSALTDGGGVLCPQCFDKRASARELLLRWWPVVTYRGNERVEVQADYMQLLTEKQ